MVKQLKYLLFIIPFLFITNVNATTLGAPHTYAYFTDGSEVNYPAVSSGYWGTNNYWASPTKIGSFTNSSPNVQEIQFYWRQANLCQNEDISISGTIAGIWNFFDEQGWEVHITMHQEELTCSFTKEESSRIKYTCFGHGGGDYQIWVKENSFNGQYLNYDIAVSKDVTLSCDVSNQAIVNQSIQNTQDIINNNTQNSQNIINNQNSNTNQIIQDNQQNTQDIINNQNSNTNKEIESQQICSSYDSSSIEFNGKYLSSSGSEISNSSFGISSYIPITSSSTLTLTRVTSQAVYLCFYDFNKSLVSCLRENDLTLNQSISIPEKSSFVRFSFQLSRNAPHFNLCMNGNQALNNSINGLNDSITSEDTPNTNQDINDMNDMVASDTPISDLITMPLTLINAYINGINSSCSPVNLGNLYGTDLILPCINLEQILGSNLWNIIDIFFCIFMCYNIGMLFVSAFDGITSLRDDFEGLYQPRHADVGYQPRHGG